MAYTVLARRYRSATFDEVVGQEQIAQPLKRAIESGRIAHAYLFCGTRGTGKTSTARILAKCLNCLNFPAPTPTPCNQCESCIAIARGDDIDVIEIDAASNTGVDNVRDLISNAQFRPARSRFKIYIIDEVHMLSKSAFNALLKTLEEPPSHVKFILATTEPEKVLPTILSRCQRYDFRNISTAKIAQHLREICAAEKIDADPQALLLVAKAGAGSMRDALSLLDRLLSLGEKQLTVAAIEQLLGLPRAQTLMDLAQAIGAADTRGVLTQAEAILSSGMSADTLIAGLSEHLRNLLVLRTCGRESGLVEVPGIDIGELDRQAQRFAAVTLTQDITILEELRRQMRQSGMARALLDATLVRLTLAEQFASIGQLLEEAEESPAGDGGVLKKKRDESVVGTVAMAQSAPAPSPGLRRAQSSHTPGEGGGEGRSEVGIDGGGGEKIGRINPTLRNPGEGGGEGLTPAPPEAATDAPPPDEDDDDDLPRPGKVWETSGPSLKELLRQHASAALTASAPTTKSSAYPVPSAAAAPSPSAEPSVEPLDNRDATRIWPLLMAQLAQNQPGLAAQLHQARLAGINDGQAVIRFPCESEMFVKRLSANGKREALAQMLSQLMGRTIGVRLECDEPGVNGAANGVAKGVANPAANGDATGTSGAARSEESSRPDPGAAVATAPARPVATPSRQAESPAGRRQSPAGANGQPGRRAAAAPAPAAPPAPADPGLTTLPLTPELHAELVANDLVQAVMNELGGEIRRVTVRE